MHILHNIIKLLAVAVLITLVLDATILAQEYNCGAYGVSEYGKGRCRVITESGPIANTGMDVWIIRGVSVLAVLAAVYILWRLTKKRKDKEQPPSAQV